MPPPAPSMKILPKMCWHAGKKQKNIVFDQLKNQNQTALTKFNVSQKKRGGGGGPVLE